MIRIITDSAADLTTRDLETPGVAVVPMSITFADGTAALDDGSMTKDEFFARLAADSKLPRTSQPSPASFISSLRTPPQPVTRSLSLPLRRAFRHLPVRRAGSCRDRRQVYIVDSGLPQGRRLSLCVKPSLREQELSRPALPPSWTALQKRVRVVAIVDNLKHLQKAGVCRTRCPRGRCTGHQAGAGSMTAPSVWWTRGRGRPARFSCAVPPVGQAGGVDPAYGYRAGVQRR